MVPVHAGQSSSQSLAASMALVTLADSLGYQRYWFAEHHNMLTIAATTPPVLIANAAARSSRIRLGSGGVMLPNHSPLVVAEQFATLEALAPGRIDLGLGRAPGSDQVVMHFLRQTGPTSDVEQFPQHVRAIQSMLEPDGAQLQLSTGASYTVRATGAATSTPPVWLLGSSMYSAQLAAALGLPYAFAHHFSGFGAAQALGLYRDNYSPSERHPTPTAFISVNVAVAATREEAEMRALPGLRSYARLGLNRGMQPAESAEEAASALPDFELDPIVRKLKSSWLIGTPDGVWERLCELAADLSLSEIMLVPNVAPLAGEDPARSLGRENTLRLLAPYLRAA